jgi:hypothetical protein
MKQFASISFLILLFFFSCQPSKPENVNQAAEQADSSKDVKVLQSDTLRYHYDSVKVYSKNPLSRNKEITDTAKATFTYPVFADAKLNKLVEAAALTSDNPDDRAYNSYKDLANVFMKQFDDYHASNPANEQTWFKEVKIRVLPQTKDWLSLEYNFAEYVGGAHVNSAVIYRNYHLPDRKLLALQDVLLPGKLAALNKIAERIFRENEGLPSSGSLEPEYFFDKGKFSLNDNFYLGKDGLHFLYNAYEIKAFAYGRTKLVIPYGALQQVLKRNFLFS